MIKHLLYMIGLTIVILLLMPYCHSALNQLVALHQFTLSHLNQIFTQGKIAFHIQQVVAVILIPLCIGLIIAGIEWTIRRRINPGLLLTVWAIWLVLITTLILNYVSPVK